MSAEGDVVLDTTAGASLTEVEDIGAGAPLSFGPPPLAGTSGEASANIATPASESQAVEPGEDEGYETAGTGDEDYETFRQRRIMENQLLLNSLGINPSATSLRGESSTGIRQSPSGSTPIQRKRKEQAWQPKYDRSGYIISLPNAGERQRMAAVEMPSDRKLLRSIADGEYQDCLWWGEGEAQRRRFGSGQSVLQLGEKAIVGGVGPDFRWRRWKGLAKELRSELNKRDKVDARDRAEPQGDKEVSWYSLLPGEACHQCRRKSEKPKMRCRNVNPPCRASFCETCCKRYSYFDFDTESRSFICPLCKNCCNCSNCIRKRNLTHLLAPSGSGRRIQSLGSRLKKEGAEGMTVQAWLEKAVEDRVGVPFDRVRLVDQATDIVTPELAPLPVEKETLMALASKPKPSKKRKKMDGGDKPKKVKKVAKEDLGGQGQHTIKLKLRLPTEQNRYHDGYTNHSRLRRQKEVDSDGDTVGEYSSDEQVRPRSAQSSLTPLSRASSPTPPPRFAFPPRVPYDMFIPPLRDALIEDTSDMHAMRNEMSPQHSGNAGEILATSLPAGMNGLHLPTSPSQSSWTADPSMPQPPSAWKSKRNPPPNANVVHQPQHHMGATGGSAQESDSHSSTHTQEEPSTWSDSVPEAISSLHRIAQTAPTGFDKHAILHHPYAYGYSMEEGMTFDRQSSMGHNHSNKNEGNGNHDLKAPSSLYMFPTSKFPPSTFEPLSIPAGRPWNCPP